MSSITLRAEARAQIRAEQVQQTLPDPQKIQYGIAELSRDVRRSYHELSYYALSSDRVTHIQQRLPGIHAHLQSVKTEMAHAKIANPNILQDYRILESGVNGLTNRVKTLRCILALRNPTVPSASLPSAPVAIPTPLKPTLTGEPKKPALPPTVGPASSSSSMAPPSKKPPSSTEVSFYAGEPSENLAILRRMATELEKASFAKDAIDYISQRTFRKYKLITINQLGGFPSMAANLLPVRQDLLEIERTLPDYEARSVALQTTRRRLIARQVGARDEIEGATLTGLLAVPAIRNMPRSLVPLMISYLPNIPKDYLDARQIQTIELVRKSMEEYEKKLQSLAEFEPRRV